MEKPKKISARTTIREILNGGGSHGLAEVARLAGVSRQRAHQIIRDEGLTYSKWIRDEQKPAKARILTSAKIPVPVRSAAIGTISELLAASDLLARGWQVFFPLVRTTACDLVAISPNGQSVRRIEVKSGRMRDGQLVFTRKKEPLCHDHYAVVLEGSPVIYIPPFDNEGPE